MTSRGRDEPATGLNDFVKKLFQMLLEHLYIDVVRWTSLGNLFVVLNTNEFTKEILPRHFKHSNFASFVRQLNKYDFHKVKVANDEKHTYEYGEDAWEFQHPEFRKDDRDALENIRRKAPLKKDTLGDQNSRFLSQVQALRQDLLQLQFDHKALLDKYRAVLESMVEVRTYNEHQHRSIGVLVRTLEQAGIKVPPLDLPNPNMLGKVLPHPHEVKREEHGGVAPPLGTSKVSQMPNVNPAISQEISQGLSEAISLSLSIAGQPVSAGIQPGILSAGIQPGMLSGVLPVVSSMPLLQPLVQEEQSAPPNQSSEGQATFEVGKPKFHVLLVEDDNVCIQLCRKFLMKYGCLVTVVTDGLHAISTVEHTKYDLVLMDIVMPNLDGATATSIIRLFDTKTPIIAMTGNIEDNDLVNYLENGMSDILAKPFTKNDLYLILSKHLLVKGDNDYALPLESSHTPIELMLMQTIPMIDQIDPIKLMDPIKLIDPMELMAPMELMESLELIDPMGLLDPPQKKPRMQ